MYIVDMDDGFKEYRRNKPQQKLYKPGSGPLRRSSYGLDSKMDNQDIDNSTRTKYQNHHGSQNSVNDDMDDSTREQLGTNIRHKKPEQQLYVPRMVDSCSGTERQSKMSMRCDNSSQFNSRRMNPEKNSYSRGYSKGGHRRDKAYVDGKDGTSNDINYNKNYRQTSETRSISPTHCNEWDKSSMDRNRDSRSMETSAGRHKASGGKPPSGRRNSAGYASDTPRPKYMMNLDNIPPRFRKQFLEQSGHYNYENSDQSKKERHPSNYSLQNSYNQDYSTHNSGTSWSQTLPSRGRGRLRDNEGFDKEKFIDNYLKNCNMQTSKRPTSSSYMNLYEPNASEDRLNKENNEMSNVSNVESPKEDDNDVSVSHNGISKASTTSSNLTENQKQETDNEPDSENTSQISTNLDWTEEVEKNITLDDMCESLTNFTKNLKNSQTEDVRQIEPRESKRSGKSRRKDRRSSSRSIRNSERRDRNRKDSNASVHHETERPRKDSNVSIQHETIFTNLKHRERERRDSHRSNRSSTIGNSRDDLDRWRSLRSYSREQSTEGRIVSQCNSRDTSLNRPISPRDNDGFRMPSAVSKGGGRSAGGQKKNNGSWVNGRTPSSDRGPSPAPVDAGMKSEAGGGRKARRRTSRRHSRTNDTPQSTATNWREEILESKKMTAPNKNTENSKQRSKTNSVSSEKAEPPTSQPGLIMLPHSSIPHLQKDLGRVNTAENSKTLFDHQNPSKPIIVQTSPTKIDMRLERNVRETSSRGGLSYDANDAARAARHRALLQEVDRADAILQAFILRGPIALADNWNDVTETRLCLQNALQRLLMTDLKYCQADNVEHNFWKILYYNFIEVLRRSSSQISIEDKPKIVKLINKIIDEGNVYFGHLVQMLEKAYKFNVEDYINDNHVVPPKGLGYVGLALISVQKLYVFLGDLARYKEQVNETNNYAKSKLWYTKAQQINPKNGRPYNQLAILAIYARRKLDAVYYYMRSLMSSNPFQSARESLLLLFDENRKKYEAAERKRRAAAESTEQKASAESGTSGGSTVGQGQRREVWRRPGEGRAQPKIDDVYDNLSSMSSVELNKSFITSYLHVHGKLITKIGMETFHECASLMLRQFRALLHRQPLPTPAARLLQLTALNMFAVETTAAPLKDRSSGGERPAWLECALGVSLLMFGALLERCCALLPEPQHTQQYADALLLLPAIKVWSDWMLCHSSVWNPPPSFNNFDVENENDPWDWLANLMNILEALDDKSIELENEMKEGYTCVRLAEDASLGGFTPLMYMEPTLAWMRSEQNTPHHAAEHALRTRKLLFFGTEYLVGVEPPVLKLEYPPEASPRYVSAVQRVQHHHPPLQHLSEGSEGEDDVSGATSGPTSLGESCLDGADEVTKKLLRRKEQLESRKATLERHRQRMQEILRSGQVSVEIEVRPRWLVPDTNCFIDHLPLLQAVVDMPTQSYVLAVPLVVMSELEGLRLGARVGAAANEALAWARAAPAVRLATTRGSLLASRAFTAERDSAQPTNDDRVLATALNLHANLATDNDTCVEEDGGSKCVRRVREVVLLTDDRNLRVKALAAELPVRDLPSFIQWAGICRQDNTKPLSTSADDTVADRN